MTLSTRKLVTKSGKIVDQRIRSETEKGEYFKQHQIKKTPGFELHHVVPLFWAESLEQYKLFDKWENMVYIDAYRHSQITQNRSRNVCMTSENDDIILTDYIGNRIKLSYRDHNILYDPRNKMLMLDYNEKLRQTDGV